MQQAQINFTTVHVEHSQL